MMVVRENFRDAEFAADVHRNAVGQTVTFVETRFEEFERVEKSFGVSSNNFNAHVEQNFADESRNFHPHKFAVFGIEI